MNKKIFISALMILVVGGVGGNQVYSKIKCNKAVEAINLLFSDEKHHMLSNKVNDKILEETQIIISQVINKEHKKHYLSELQHAKSLYESGKLSPEDDCH